VNKRFALFYLYILKCATGAYYTGYTNNLVKRLNLHKNGRGAKYLRGKTPLEPVYIKTYRYYKSAVKAERKIKSYTRIKKDMLIKKNAPVTAKLYKKVFLHK
jgi:putative endonuclease